jgi:hypothetical protein
MDRKEINVGGGETGVGTCPVPDMKPCGHITLALLNGLLVN